MKTMDQTQEGRKHRDEHRARALVAEGECGLGAACPRPVAGRGGEARRSAVGRARKGARGERVEPEGGPECSARRDVA